MGTNPTIPPPPPESKPDFIVKVDEKLQHEIDPVAYGQNIGTGLAQSDILDELWLVALRVVVYPVDWLVSRYFDAHDRVIAFIADQISKAVNRNIPGFWVLIGSLISDLLGVEVDGGKIFSDLQTKGTLPAMRDVGGGLIDLLVGEFTGTAGGTGGTVTTGAEKNAVTGLPEATLTPKGGVEATKALMGFVLSSAVRQANIDGIVDPIPLGLGKVFEKYSDAMRTNLGIGRLMRFALRPIFQDLVAKPLTWAVNLQYRPALHAPEDLLLQGLLNGWDDAKYDYELGRHGFTLEQQGSLKARHYQKISLDEARVLHIHGDMDDADYHDIARRHGWRTADLEWWEKYQDLHPARRLALAVVEEAAVQYIRGHIPQTQLQAAIDASSVDRFGHRLLSEGEQNALSNFSVTAQKLIRRHLSVAQLMIGYIEGVLTLGEVEEQLSALGFDDNDVKALVQEMLVKQKQAVDRAARTHARAPAHTPGGSTPPPTAP
jgi:hypothetical protein